MSLFRSEGEEGRPKSKALKSIHEAKKPHVYVPPPLTILRGVFGPRAAASRDSLTESCCSVSLSLQGTPRWTLPQGQTPYMADHMMGITLSHDEDGARSLC